MLERYVEKENFFRIGAWCMQIPPRVWEEKRNETIRKEREEVDGSREEKKKKKKSKEQGEQICNGYVASSVPSSPTFSPPVPPHVLPSFSDDAATLFPLENDNLIPVGYSRPIMLRDKKITPSEHPWKMQRGQKLLSASRKE